MYLKTYMDIFINILKMVTTSSQRYFPLSFIKFVTLTVQVAAFVIRYAVRYGVHVAQCSVLLKVLRAFCVTLSFNTICDILQNSFYFVILFIAKYWFHAF